MNKEPELIVFDQIGESETGFISIAEELENIPFEIKRTYWTYFTPNHIQRGRHAHCDLEQVIVAVSGEIVFKLESKEGKLFEFVLDKPSVGLYVPPGYWREIQFSHNAVLMCLASEKYKESDYIRDYNKFKNGC